MDWPLAIQVCCVEGCRYSQPSTPAVAFCPAHGTVLMMLWVVPAPPSPPLDRRGLSGATVI